MALRASNTQPALVARCESSTENGLKYKKNLIEQLNKIDKNLLKKYLVEKLNLISNLIL